MSKHGLDYLIPSKPYKSVDAWFAELIGKRVTLHCHNSISASGKFVGIHPKGVLVCAPTGRIFVPWSAICALREDNGPADALEVL